MKIDPQQKKEPTYKSKFGALFGKIFQKKKENLHVIGKEPCEPEPEEEIIELEGDVCAPLAPELELDGVPVVENEAEKDTKGDSKKETDSEADLEEVLAYAGEICPDETR